jgi:hypothetical protein
MNAGGSATLRKGLHPPVRATRRLNVELVVQRMAPNAPAHLVTINVVKFRLQPPHLDGDLQQPPGFRLTVVSQSCSGFISPNL